jgi:hypothetical protein
MPSILLGEFVDSITGSLGQGALGDSLNRFKKCQLLHQYHDGHDRYRGRNTSIAPERLHSGSRLHHWRNQSDTAYIRHARAIKIWPLDVKSKIQQDALLEVAIGMEGRARCGEEGDD